MAQCHLSTLESFNWAIEVAAILYTLFSLGIILIFLSQKSKRNVSLSFLPDNIVKKDDQSSKNSVLATNVSIKIDPVTRGIDAIPPKSKWPNHPIYVCQSHSREKPEVIHKPDKESEIVISNEYFEGRALLWVNGMSDSPTHMFKGRQRSFQFVVQGQFKKPLSFAKVWTGQPFLSSLGMTPPQWLVSTLTPLVSTIQPGCKIVLETKNPYMLSPLMTTMQNIAVNRPGEEPTIYSRDLKEDLTLLDPLFTGMTPSARKAFFNVKENREKFVFNPDHVYTLDFYQHVASFASFKLELGLLNYCVCSILGRNPLAITATLFDPSEDNEARERWETAYCIEVWHERQSHFH